MMGFMIRGGVGTVGWSKYIIYPAKGCLFLLFISFSFFKALKMDGFICVWRLSLYKEIRLIYTQKLSMIRYEAHGFSSYKVP